MSKGLNSRFTGGSGFKVPGGVKMAIVIDDEMFEKVGEMAMQADISLAAMIRELISKGLSDQPVKEEA